jgi:hypothetical protein
MQRRDGLYRSDVSRRKIAVLLAVAAACCVAAVVVGAFAPAVSSASPTCTIYWTGTTSTEWSTPTNWSLTNGGGSAGRVPGSSDYVCMSTSPARASAVLASGAVTIGGIEWPEANGVQPSLRVSGTLTLGDSTVVDPSTIDQLTVAGGILVSFTGETVTADELTLSVATTFPRLEGPGTLVVSGSASLAAAYLGPSSGTTAAAHLVLEGASTLSTPSGNLVVENGSELENEGTLTLADGSVISGAGTVLNDSGGTISYTGSASTKSATVSIAITNEGTVSVGAGTLFYGVAGANVTDSGAFVAAAGATLDLLGTRTEGAAATLSGEGTVEVQGTVTVSAASNLGSIGTFELNGEKSVLVIDAGVSATAHELTLTGTYPRLEGPGTLVVSGSASLAAAHLGPPSGTTAKAHLVLQGASTLSTPSGNLVVENGSELENEGTLTLADGSVISGAGTVPGTVLNDSGGTISYTGSASNQKATVKIAITNEGTVAANSGTLVLASLTNLNTAGELAGGVYDTAGGVISLPQHSVTTNAATITLGASPSAFTWGSANALATLQTNTGSLTLKQSLTVGAFANSGTVTIENGGTLGTTSFMQTAGTTTVVGGATLQAGSGTGNVTISAGTLTGTGQIQGDLLGAGNVMPAGTVAGPMIVTGTYDVSTGTLTIPVKGATTEGTDYGQLEVAGAATLGGTLTFSTASGFVPPIGTQYTVLKAASVTGTFSTINGTQLGDRQYVVSYTPTSVVATVEPLPPTVTNVTPNTGPLAGGTSVTITGTSFIEVTAVKFESTEATQFTVNSATSITAVSPAGTGTVNVTVTTPEGTSTTSPADEFSYVESATPRPTITKLKPKEGPGTGGTSVTITGTKFTGATAVKFGSTNASSFTIKSATSITAKSPSGSGTVDVTVTTPEGTSLTSSADQFHYLPAVTKVSPVSGPVGGGTTVTITGVEFTGATSVKFGSIEATSFTVNSATSITAVSPEELAGIVDVRVSTPEGTSPISSKDKFKFTPTVTGLSPKTGSTAGGTTVTVAGTGFATGTTATIFKFGSAAGTAVNCTSTTECTVVAPAHAAGKVDVKATVNKVSSPKAAADQFTYS